jgi:hypothetical protein
VTVAIAGTVEIAVTGAIVEIAAGANAARVATMTP